MICANPVPGKGKKQLNQLRTYLDNKGGNAKDGLGAKGDNGLRTVRAKREADEAGALLQVTISSLSVN